MNEVKISRDFGWPTHATFSCPPINSFVMKYLRQSKVSVDPFARNFDGCTYTNDFNSKTTAGYHMDAVDFLKLLKDKGVQPDLVVLDPPYSPTQAKEMYGIAGAKFNGSTLSIYASVKQLVNDILLKEGIVLTFGWSSYGMAAIHTSYKIIEILLVWHGQARNDTICMAEQRMTSQEVFPFK